MKLKDCRVLVTPTSFGRDDPKLKEELERRVQEVTYNTTGEPLTAQQLKALLPGMDGYIAGLDEIDREALEAADRLQVVARYGVGVDNVDRAAAREMGIVVTNTPAANAVSVAELAVGLILAQARSLVKAVQATRAGCWPRLPGTTLEGKTVGLIGLGDIGKAAALRLSGFGCRLVAFDIAPDGDFAGEHGVELLPRDEVLAQADVLSLHCSLVPATRGMVDASFLAKMKTGAVLVNTARGEIVIEADLLEALESGKLSGAALDVFSQQPPDPENPLLDHDQVLVTPHMGAHTDGATGHMGWGAVRNCFAVLEGREPENPVSL